MRVERSVVRLKGWVVHISTITSLKLFNNNWSIDERGVRGVPVAVPGDFSPLLAERVDFGWMESTHAKREGLHIKMVGECAQEGCHIEPEWSTVGNTGGWERGEDWQNRSARALPVDDWSPQ